MSMGTERGLMNVVLVVLDSLRKDCIGAYGSPPWGQVQTPHFDAFAEESLMMTRAYPEWLPTLPARRALYTGQRVYPFYDGDFRLKGDFVGAPGWGPIPENQATLAERLKENGYRTGLIADVHHMFKPSKNYWRGFDQWTFLRGKEMDPQRSGPKPSEDEIDYWLPEELRTERRIWFIGQCLMNMYDRTSERDYLAARVLQEAATWLEQNRDADKFFLTVESFDPHEPWFVPRQYRKMYDEDEGREQVITLYGDTSVLDEQLLRRTRANYSASVTLCDRWFGHFMESLQTLGLLPDTLVILTSDHGHSLGEKSYMGKRGYPAAPEVFDVPLLVRHAEGKGAGQISDLFVQHTDITAMILEAAGVEMAASLHGNPFFEKALAGGPPLRDRVTVGYGSAAAVVNDRWWFNCKVNGKGPFLYDLGGAQSLETNVASESPDIVRELFSVAIKDAGGEIPAWVTRLADEAQDAPGCSALAVRE
jgi:arylsulfatase A-like enzyme